MNNSRINIVSIVPGTSVDGPGLRTSIYFAGCDHRCPGCQNPQTWDREAGIPMTVEEIMAEVRANGFNVTFSGGDPLQCPINAIALAEAVKAAGFNLWIYTGYTFEEIVADPELAPILMYADVIVDGPFIESLRDISLHFRGSSNQRLIDVSATLKAGEVVCIDRK